ncbi:Transposon Ty3-I Gag-Pol polyprotein [Araneus ventricosus]|uniref:Transposon Ty3-I Gag-Pol polyprotein n=1 Tax=Araneus ventricosus TaxID=182803 RepID=A0A4Y2C518_ARAVE|nr:Transposon Ty3-I Gag-Pol polyprotein [Araneus ventricosus]
MAAGQEEMRSGQERMEKGQEEMKGLIDEVKGEVQRKIDEVEEKVQIQLVASLRGSAAEVLQGIPANKFTDITTIEKALESRFGDSHLTQFYGTELKTRRQKTGESLQELDADVERLMSLAYAEFPLDVRESLAAQYFVDAIRDEDTQHSTRLMAAEDLKSSLAYSMTYEAARTVSKTSRHVRSIETEHHMSSEGDDKFELFFNRLEKLLNSSVAGKKNTPRRNSNVTCWKCNKKGARSEEVPDDYFEPGKLTYGCLAGRRLPSLNKAPEEGPRVSSLSGKKLTLLRRIYLRYPVFNVGGYRYAVTDFPRHVSQKVILVAAALVNLEREAIPVRVLNLNNKPKMLDEGAVIATCEPVVDIVVHPQEFSGEQHRPSSLDNLEIFDEGQRTAVRKLLKEFQNLFSTCDDHVGRCNMKQHRINMGDHPPIKQYPRRLPLARKEEAYDLVKEMVGNGIIEESSGPWTSPIVLAKKKDGLTRFCVDYRKLNEIMKKDRYPLPRIDDRLDALNGSQLFTTLDLKTGYWQVEIRPEDREKTLAI